MLGGSINPASLAVSSAEAFTPVCCLQKMALRTSLLKQQRERQCVLSRVPQTFDVDGFACLVLRREGLECKLICLSKPFRRKIDLYSAFKYSTVFATEMANKQLNM